MDPFKNVRANKMPLNTTFSLSSYIERRESQLAERERNRHDSANFVSAKSQKGTSIIIVNGRRNDLPSSSCSKQITEPSQNISTKNLDIPQKLSHRKRTFSEGKYFLLWSMLLLRCKVNNDTRRSRFLKNSNKVLGTWSIIKYILSLNCWNNLEVLELSRHQIVLTRTKTVDVSLLPPKRIKSGFFNPTPRHRLSHCRNEGSCEVYDHRQKDEQYKRLMPSPRSSLMPIGCSSHSGIERIPNRNQMCHSFPPFTVTVSINILIP